MDSLNGFLSIGPTSSILNALSKATHTLLGLLVDLHFGRAHPTSEVEVNEVPPLLEVVVEDEFLEANELYVEDVQAR
jgi:hypothetical protein